MTDILHMEKQHQDMEAVCFLCGLKSVRCSVRSSCVVLIFSFFMKFIPDSCALLFLT